MNIYENLLEYIAKNYKPLNNWIYFNTSTMEDGNTSLNTITGTTVNEYNDGSRDIELIFAIAMIQTYDTGTSDTNLDAISEVNHFIEWFESESMKNILFENTQIIINELTVLDTTPLLSVDMAQNLAKYQFNCSLKFLKKGSI